MLWQIQRDFLSLFHCGNSNENYFKPIDGLRSISNISIILLHLVAVFSTFVLPYPHQEWQQFLKSAAFALNSLMSLTLEIFFMLSGFLLTHKIITQWNKNPPNSTSFLQKEYPTSILKRALRFWPGFILATLIMLIFGEPRYPNSGNLFELFRHLNIWLFFQNYINLDYWFTTFAPLWSLSIDMQVHIVLPVLLFLFYSIRRFISVYNCLLILLLISIIRGIIVFDPVAMPVASIANRYPALQLLSPDYFIRWVQTNYNLTLSSDLPDTNPAKLFMKKMYLPLEARFGSFIIGAMLAIKIIECSNSVNQKSKTFKKYLFFVLIFLQILTTIPNPDAPLPSEFVMKLAIGSMRQIFTIGQAFILFSVLCPSSHPYHAPWLKKFFSLRIWNPIAKLSYFVYLVHLRISFELIFGGPLRFLETYSVTYASLISLPIIFLISLFISCLWYVLAEQPIQRAIKVYPLNKKSFNTHML